MLVTVAIIVLLLTVVIVALSQAARGAQRARTQFLMSSISQGLTAFKGDHGYLPPILGRDPSVPIPEAQKTHRDGYAPPDPTTSNYLQQLQQYRSATSLAEYMLGYGDRRQDGYGRVGAGLAGSPGDRETPVLGFRSPGDDGVWGAWTNPRPNFPATGSLFSRNPGGVVNPANLNPFGAPNVNANNDVIVGQTYGPYISLADERLLGAITPNGDIVFPGEGEYDATLPKVIVDYWGQPILYYRRPHQPRNPAAADLRTHLGDVFALRPWSIPPGQDIDGAADAAGDTGSTRTLRAAEYALFSAGPDRTFDEAQRNDPDGFNRDNIVELGQ